MIKMSHKKNLILKHSKAFKDVTIFVIRLFKQNVGFAQMLRFALSVADYVTV